MRKIKLLAKGLTQTEIDAAVALAIASGCSAEEIEIVQEVGQPDPDCDEELVIFVLAPALCADPSIEGELKKTPNGGRRAICVWPDGAEPKQQPPAAAEKYAYSIIQPKPEKFSAVAADDDVMYRETPDGTPLPKVKMEHNECVEEKAKPA